MRLIRERGVIPKKSLLMEEMERIHPISLPKEMVPNYTFRRTVCIHNRLGHIFIHDLSGKYVLCLSSDETVRINEEDGVMFGYHRDNMEGIMSLVTSFQNSEQMIRGSLGTRYGVRHQHGAVLMTPIPFVQGQRWNTRIKGVCLENVKTGQVYDLTGRFQITVMKDLKIQPYQLHGIIHLGLTCRNWRVKTVPLV